MVKPDLAHAQAATMAGDPGASNEDWYYADGRLCVVLDGATARTETGCEHGVHWYAAQLGAAIVRLAHVDHENLTSVLRTAIADVAALHPQCDLTHAGTPSAGVGIAALSGSRARWLVLGDVSVVIDAAGGLQVMADHRVSRTAAAERRLADRYPIGSEEKSAALLHMKAGELAARNVPGGYWIAAAEPAAAEHALVGSTDSWQRLVVASDGVARLVDAFGLMTWADVMDTLDESGPDHLVSLVRKAERSDPRGERWPRNKASDDATVVYIRNPTT